MSTELGNLSEEGLLCWLKRYLDYGEITNDEFPAKGASSWYPYGYSLIKNILSLASALLSKRVGFDEIVLPSFVHGEDFMKECHNIKDFSERVYWSPLYREDDLHVVTPTIEAQLGALYAEWLREDKALPFKYFTIRGVGRYETGRTIPLWKERNVWPFFEGLSAHNSKSDFLLTIQKQIVFMKFFFKKLGIPTIIIERPKINPRLREYSERRIEAITMTPDRRVVILANIYDLGEIFSKVYDICYSVKGKQHYALTSAIGLSGRVLAVLLAINGDENGFILSPSLAPIMAALVPVYNKPVLHDLADKIRAYLIKKKIIVKIFPAINSLGERRRKIAAMGIPFVVEIGPREIKNSWAFLKPRAFLHPVNTEIKKIPAAITSLSRQLERIIKSRALQHFGSLNRCAKSKQELIKFTKEEFLTKALFCDEPSCYEKASRSTKAEIIGRACNDIQNSKNRCIICGNKAIQNIYFGIKWKGEK
jgi:prolyl-tRNA synthetase